MPPFSLCFATCYVFDEMTVGADVSIG
jgi:hypothetical protein